jgi:hypothetical protein
MSEKELFDKEIEAKIVVVSQVIFHPGMNLSDLTISAVKIPNIKMWYQPNGSVYYEDGPHKGLIGFANIKNVVF